MAGSGPVSGETGGHGDGRAWEPDLVGRDRERADVERHLDAAGGGPVGLLITGDVGVGKSALWRAAVTSASRRKYVVLTARPVEAEAGLAFAALGDLLRPVLDTLPRYLPSLQQRAIRVALLIDDPGDTPPDQLAVSVATLGLLGALATEAPVVLAIDDAQWLDAPSARVLAFCLRRLTRERVALVAASRTEVQGSAGPRFSDVGGHEPDLLAVPPLSVDALDEVFRRQLGGSFPRPILTQIAAASGGNPLFALEIARAVHGGTIHVRPGERLEVPRTVEEFVRERLGSVEDRVRELLFVAAAVPDPTIGLLSATGIAADPQKVLEIAVDAGAIEIDPDGRVAFNHPVFASVVYHDLGVARRRELHGRLADLVSDPHERARHLSLATDAPDAGVALALDGAARDAASRGAPDAAAELAERALAMTPHDDQASAGRRQLDAAEYHFASGSTARARTLLEGVVACLPRGTPRSDALRRLAKVRYRGDSCSVAAELLTQALDEAGEDVPLRAGIHRDLAWAVTLCGDLGEAGDHASEALALLQQPPGDPLLAEAAAAKAMTDLLSGRGLDGDAMERVVRMERPRPDVPIEWRPRMIHAMLLRWAEDLPAARARFNALHRETLDAGDETSLPFVLAQLSEAETLAGDARAGLDHADAAHALALQTGQEPIRAAVLHARALAQAHLGLADEARVSARAGIERSQAAGSVVWMLLNQSVLGFIERTLDDAPAAHALLGPLVAWADVIGLRDPGVLRFVPDEVESLVAIGENAKAEALLGPYEADAVRLGRPVARLAAARARGTCLAAAGDPDEGARLLAAALRESVRFDQPFERARAMLALGSIERRTRRRSAARRSLEAARAMFEALEAPHWVGQADRALGRSTQSPSTTTATLTPAERRVADLVAGGVTNRAAADRLFVSVRAVEVHLTSIYRKLGIHSRSQLAARLARESPVEINQTDDGHGDEDWDRDPAIARLPARGGER